MYGETSAPDLDIIDEITVHTLKHTPTTHDGLILFFSILRVSNHVSSSTTLGPHVYLRINIKKNK